MTKQWILVDLIREVRQRVVHEEFGQLGRTLNRISKSDAEPDVILAWLRSAYAAKSRIPRFGDYVEQARVNLTDRGIDNTDELLRGLRR